MKCGVTGERCSPLGNRNVVLTAENRSVFETPSCVPTALSKKGTSVLPTIVGLGFTCGMRQPSIRCAIPRERCYQRRRTRVDRLLCPTAQSSTYDSHSARKFYSYPGVLAD